MQPKRKKILKLIRKALPKRGFNSTYLSFAAYKEELETLTLEVRSIDLQILTAIGSVFGSKDITVTSAPQNRLQIIVYNATNPAELHSIKDTGPFHRFDLEID